jgi:hypothetical protein
VFQPERERTMSLHAPSGILNMEDEHEAKVLFHGFRGFWSGTTLIEAMREKRSRMQTGFKR